MNENQFQIQDYSLRLFHILMIYSQDNIPYLCKSSWNTNPIDQLTIHPLKIPPYYQFSIALLWYLSYHLPT